MQKAFWRSPTNVLLQAGGFKASSLLVPLKSFDVYTISISDEEAKSLAFKYL